MKARKISGFTFVEALVALLIVSALLILVGRIVSSVRSSVSKGVANLQNLQQARSLLNSIRRDFIVSSPVYDRNDDYSSRAKVRMEPVVTQKTSGKFPQPLFVSDDTVLLYKRLADSSIESVSYHFDARAGRITRTSDKNPERVFDGIKKASFKVYSLHENLSPHVPLLWVSVTVEHTEAGEKQVFDLATTIGSSIICKDINNQYWNGTR
ncbi:MAG: hypothetical protein CVV41_02975 [Candidatus Riflebacteria bacterium HGW-Riflebacteria-1]|jgi:type II secretory pathway pseudopilin PulG|nr:MAG: hypothetical protein CVV41_02975 [Candidatus Riflebacteria bacterium HGW-Riflebacteria-1]